MKKFDVLRLVNEYNADTMKYAEAVYFSKQKEFIRGWILNDEFYWFKQGEYTRSVD